MPNIFCTFFPIFHLEKNEYAFCFAIENMTVISLSFKFPKSTLPDKVEVAFVLPPYDALTFSATADHHHFASWTLLPWLPVRKCVLDIVVASLC